MRSELLWLFHRFLIGFLVAYPSSPPEVSDELELLLPQNSSLDSITWKAHQPKNNVDPVEEETLEIHGNLPSLIFLFVTSKAAAPKERLGVSSSMFKSLEEFYFTCWSNGTGVMFEVGTMPRLEKLRVPFNAGTGLNFGIQHLSSLRHLIVKIICSGTMVQEVEALEESIRSATDLLPNRPSLELRTWDEEKMAKEERMFEEIYTGG